MRKLYQLLPWRKTAQPPATEQADDQAAHIYLGNMYLALGHTDQAEAEYRRAQALCPSDESEKQLAAIRKRRAEQNLSTDTRAPSCRAA
jgi:cytochrome c-type biogenesis protein CcmH/NrfG